MGQDVGLDLLGDRAPLLRVALLTLQIGQLRSAVQCHPAHDLAGGEVLRLAAHLPDAAVGFAPVLDGLLDLILQDRPQRLGHLLTRFGVQVHRIQHGAPDIVLHLVVRAVADAHRPGVVIPRQMVQFLLDEAAFAADAVHHLQGMAFAVGGPGHVGDEGEEVIGLAVQAQGVQTPQREGGISDPRVSVIPVAFSLWGFRERCAACRQQRPGRGVHQPLQGQRAALQICPPGMVGKVTDVDPLAPRLAGLPHLVRGFLEILRRRVFRPAERDEHLVTLGEPGARAGLVSLQADAQVGGQAQRRVCLGVLAGAGDRLTVGRRRVFPRRGAAAVVEVRLAAHHQLDGAADAAHGAQQDVLGIPVGGGAAMGPRAGLGVVPGTHHQRVPDDHPAGMGLPGGFHDETAGQVAPCRGHRDAVRAQLEVTGATVQDGPEDARGIRPRHAQPLHGSRRGDQTGALAVGQEGVIRDGRERVSQGSGRGVRDGSRCRERCRRRIVLGVFQNHDAHHECIIVCRLVRASCGRFPLSAGQTRVCAPAAARSRRRIR